MNQYSETEETIKQIRKYLLMWLGIIVCGLCALSFFITTKGLMSILTQSELDFGSSDSDVSVLLHNIELNILKFGIWLKSLPLINKVIGFVLGGIIWFLNKD
jgi:hypothetical protein